MTLSLSLSLLGMSLAAQYRLIDDVCLLQETPLTNYNTGFLLCLHGDTKQICFLRHASPPVQCGSFLHVLNSSGKKTSTLRKRLICVGAIINYAYQEPEVEKCNPLSKMIIVGEGRDAVKRGTFTTE